MTPADHYGRAMRLMEQAADAGRFPGVTLGQRPTSDLLAEAQVHATLALSAGQLDKGSQP
jgi:hypothetical protein